MAVDQARHLNFSRETLISHNHINNPIQITNNLYINGNTINSLGPVGAGAGFPASADESLIPFYNLADVVFRQQQLSGAGKITDTGVIFNNSIVPPLASVSRKRPRESEVFSAPISGGGAPSLPTVNPITTSSIVSKQQSNSFSFLGKDISLQIMQQQSELDRLISQHIQKMRMEIEDRKMKQLRRIMAAIEENMAKRLRDKEEEIEKIGKLNWALEERVKSLCIENQIWKDLAQTNEAKANVLRINLEQVLQHLQENVDRTAAAAGVGELTDDAVSCCGSSGYAEEEKEGGGGERWRKVAKRTVVTEEREGNSWIYRGKHGE